MTTILSTRRSCSSATLLELSRASFSGKNLKLSPKNIVSVDASETIKASKKRDRPMLKSEYSKIEYRVPLSQVVSDCSRRWFKDTLEEAKAGDIPMQVMVGQMYCSGYGVSKDVDKGKAWIKQASKYYPSIEKVCGTYPVGCNETGSDKDDDEKHSGDGV